MISIRHGWVIVLAVCALMVGCTPAKAPEQMGWSLKTLKTEMQMGRDNVVATTAALRSLRESKGADVQPRYANFEKNLEALESKAGGIQMVGQMSRENTTSFFAKWDQQIDQIQDKNLSAAAADRRKQVMAQYDSLRAKIQKLREAYRPYYANLTDVRTAVKADTTAQGVTAARPAIDKAISQESAVLARLDEVTRAIDAMVEP